MYRDNRLNHIHEGTHAIHGIDLLGRKSRHVRWRCAKTTGSKMNETIAEAPESLTEQKLGLKKAIAALEETVSKVLACENPDLRLANATRFLDAFGHIVVAWLWLMQANAAEKSLANNPEDAFLSGKVTACKFFFRHLLPEIYPSLELVASLDDTNLQVSELEFAGI